MTEISRTAVSTGVAIVQRERDGNYELLQEVTTNSGEIPTAENALITIETITITRTIGIKQNF